MKDTFLKKDLQDILPMKDKGGDIYIMLSPGNTGNENMIMGYAVTPVGEIVKAHCHPASEECFFTVKGQGSVLFESGDIIEFKQNEAVRIPKKVVHTIKNTGSEELCVLFASAPLAHSMEVGHVNGGVNEKNN